MFKNEGINFPKYPGDFLPGIMFFNIFTSPFPITFGKSIFGSPYLHVCRLIFLRGVRHLIILYSYKIFKL